MIITVMDEAGIPESLDSGSVKKEVLSTKISFLKVNNLNIPNTATMLDSFDVSIPREKVVNENVIVSLRQMNITNMY